MNDLARQLLTTETKGLSTPGELAAATDRLCSKQLRYLSRLLGRDGSHAILRRSLKLAQTRFPSVISVKPSETGGLQGLLEAIQEQQPARRLEICVGVLESFLALLASFVGEDLARKVVAEALVHSDTAEDTIEGTAHE